MKVVFFVCQTADITALSVDPIPVRSLPLIPIPEPPTHPSAARVAAPCADERDRPKRKGEAWP